MTFPVPSLRVRGAGQVDAGEIKLDSAAQTDSLRTRGLGMSRYSLEQADFLPGYRHRSRRGHRRQRTPDPLPDRTGVALTASHARR